MNTGDDSKTLEEAPFACFHGVLQKANKFPELDIMSQVYSLFCQLIVHLLLRM
jgi:hypothetical protein